MLMNLIFFDVVSAYWSLVGDIRGVVICVVVLLLREVYNRVGQEQSEERLEWLDRERDHSGDGQ